VTEPVISHHPDEAGRRGTFDLTIGDTKSGFLSYSLDDNTIVVDYVQVDPSLRGKGLGDRLVAAAVEWARAHKRKVVPICSYARAVMRRKTEYHDVLER